MSNIESDYGAAGQTGDFANPLDDIISAMIRVNNNSYLIYTGKRNRITI